MRPASTTGRFGTRYDDVATGHWPRQTRPNARPLHRQPRPIVGLPLTPFPSWPGDATRPIQHGRFRRGQPTGTLFTTRRRTMSEHEQQTTPDTDETLAYTLWAVFRRNPDATATPS